MSEAERRGDVVRVDAPDGSAIAFVKPGERKHVLDDGRVLRIDWNETLPPQPGRVTIEEPQVDHGLMAVSFLEDAAREIRQMDGRSADDRNVLICEIRDLAKRIAGHNATPEFPLVPVHDPQRTA
ncbi:hypothetical protein [Sorangium sp. So ce233]|uniref:hypothetical protein n=1 Tax=Sorangium sp. So ce233 TaxID=3133290 RepID=UPI003F626CD8